MKKISSFLEKHIINVATLILLLALIVFISNTINTYVIFKLINKSFDITSDYNSFMTNYYQTQANWLMFWLTLLACLTAIIGIAIPFVLNQSYKDKIKEMENEFQKQLKDLDNYKKQSAENLKILKNDVKLVKNQAEQSKRAIPKILSKELHKFKENMQDAIDNVKQESILQEISALEDLRFNYDLNEKKDEELRTLNRIIHIAEKSKKQFSKANMFKQALDMHLERGYYSRGLLYQYDKKEYINAISDYIHAKELGILLRNDDNETINNCLLYCYAKLKKYNECNELLDCIKSLFPRDVSETIQVLERDNSNEAKELVERINGMIVSPY